MDKDTIHKHLTSGKPAIIRDDTDDLCHSALVFPAEKATEAVINECLHFSVGASASVALGPSRASSFQLQPMGFNFDRDQHRKGITPRELVSVEARTGVTTGISAADRATTVQLLGATNPSPRDIVKPGHVFPIRVREGGVLVRSAIPEAVVDLMNIFEFTDAGCFFELYGENGEYATREEVDALAAKHSLPICPISELIAYRLKNEELVQRVSEVKLPTSYQSDMKAFLYRSKVHQGDHIAIVKGEIKSGTPTLTRVHPESTFQDVFGPGGAGKETPLGRALQAIGDAEVGVVVYLRRPDKQPLSLELKKDSPYLQARGATMKEYGVGAQILRDLGVCEINLLSSSSAPAAGLASYGLRVVQQSPLP